MCLLDFVIGGNAIILKAVNGYISVLSADANWGTFVYLWRGFLLQKEAWWTRLEIIERNRRGTSHQGCRLVTAGSELTFRSMSTLSKRCFKLLHILILRLKVCSSVLGLPEIISLDRLHRLSDPHFLNAFRLAQLVIEYLTHSQVCKDWGPVTQHYWAPLFFLLHEQPSYVSNCMASFAFFKPRLF